MTPMPAAPARRPPFSVQRAVQRRKQQRRRDSLALFLRLAAPGTQRTRAAHQPARALLFPAARRPLLSVSHRRGPCEKTPRSHNGERWPHRTPKGKTSLRTRSPAGNLRRAPLLQHERESCFIFPFVRLPAPCLARSFDQRRTRPLPLIAAGNALWETLRAQSGPVRPKRAINADRCWSMLSLSGEQARERPLI